MLLRATPKAGLAARLSPMSPTVAIVEDEEGLREAVAEYLAGRGFRILSAANAGEMRAIAEREAIDVARYCHARRKRLVAGALAQVESSQARHHFRDRRRHA